MRYRTVEPWSAVCSSVCCTSVFYKTSEPLVKHFGLQFTVLAPPLILKKFYKPHRSLLRFSSDFLEISERSIY